MILEINVHRIGGVDGPRHWRCESAPIALSCIERVNLDAYTNASLWMAVQLSAWAPAAIEEFYACRAQLIGINGENLGTRPAYLYSRPHDIPTYTSFERVKEHGLYVLSLRIISE